jgi:succinyl-CoA synthetase beta subunit
MTESESLSEHVSKQVLAAHGVAIAPERMVDDLEGAKAAAVELGWPLVVKACGNAIAHKTERGLVVLGVNDEASLEAAFQQIKGRLTPADGDAGVLIASMVPGNRELICGVDVSEQFGPVIMIGLGGILAEAIEDVVFRALPITRTDALEMLDQLQARAILDEFRGEPAADRTLLADTIVAVGEAAASVEHLLSLDVNPIILVDGAPVAVDALIVQEGP